MRAKEETRRGFLGKATVAGAALAAAGAVSTARGDDEDEQRRAIPARPGAPFSRAVSFDGVVFVAGVVGRAPGESGMASAEFAPQCQQALENLKASVEASGSSMGKVMKCNCFLTDVRDFPAFNKVFRLYFPSSPPARSTVVVKELVVPGAKIEIDCVTCLA